MSEPEPMIRVSNLSVRRGDFLLAGIHLEVQQGEYVALMGRTASGKTTLLEALCGLATVQEGSVWIAGANVTDASPAQRGVGYVPQDGALFRTMSVRDHLAFGPRLKRWPAGAVRQRVEELVERLGLHAVVHRRPRGLSGGERQRVALGRALAAKPAVLILDEPLAALDEDTQEELAVLLGVLRDEGKITALHVTHSRREARRLAQRILVLRGQGLEEMTE